MLLRVTALLPVPAVTGVTVRRAMARCLVRRPRVPVLRAAPAVLAVPVRLPVPVARVPVVPVRAVRVPVGRVPTR